MAVNSPSVTIPCSFKAPSCSNDRPKPKGDGAVADALNLRVHVPGETPTKAREQIARLGDEVLASLRAELGW